MDKRKIVRYLLITLSVILGVLVFLSITGTVAHAAGLVDNTVSDANAYSKYPLENYQLDFYVDSSWDWLPWNWLDGIGKSIQYGLYAITNFVWTVSLYISNATGYVVQEAYKLDFISDTANSIGKNIQTLAGVTSSGFPHGQNRAFLYQIPHTVRVATVVSPVWKTGCHESSPHCLFPCCWNRAAQFLCQAITPSCLYQRKSH
jgi:hypothetical protein